MTFAGEIEPTLVADTAPTNFDSERDAAGIALSQHAMGLGKVQWQQSESPMGLGRWNSQQNSTLGLDTNTLIAAGTGFVAGAAITGAGEVALVKSSELVARGMIAFPALIFGMTEHYNAFVYQPTSPWYRCLTPKPVAIGGAVVATLAAGGYEAYRRWGK